MGKTTFKKQLRTDIKTSIFRVSKQIFTNFLNALFRRQIRFFFFQLRRTSATTTTAAFLPLMDVVAFVLRNFIFYLKFFGSRATLKYRLLTIFSNLKHTFPKKTHLQKKTTFHKIQAKIHNFFLKKTIKNTLDLIA